MYLHGNWFIDVVMNVNAFKRDIDVVELGLRIMNESVTASVGGSSP